MTDSEHLQKGPVTPGHVLSQNERAHDNAGSLGVCARNVVAAIGLDIIAANRQTDGRTNIAQIIRDLKA